MRKPRRKTTKIQITRNQRVYHVTKVTRTVLQCERPYVLFGEAVRSARASIGITQLELSKKMGMSRGSIANIEVGRQRILLSDVFDFAKALKLKPHVLFKAVQL